MNNIDELLKDGKYQILCKAFKGLEAWKVPEGDYLEFGVFEGMSFKHACHLSKRFNHKNMHFYAFDSFQGLPKPTLEEENKYEHFNIIHSMSNSHGFLRVQRRVSTKVFRLEFNQ